VWNPKLSEQWWVNKSNSLTVLLSFSFERVQCPDCKTDRLHGAVRLVELIS
jgi:hypothetical protein